VVKANGYGHGAVIAAVAAKEGGAAGLAVASVAEGEHLRTAGLTGPILILSEPPVETMGRVARAGLEPTVSSAVGIEAAAANGPLRVHLKIDTGMHRVGVAPSDAVHFAQLIRSSPTLELASVWTHCAVADSPTDPFTGEQLRRFDAALSALDAAGMGGFMTHAANSAAGLAHVAARHDLVRAGIAIYGLAPSAELMPWCSELRPALRLVARVAAVRTVDAGEGVSYGRRYRPTTATIIATVPLGYADGVPRRLFAEGGTVLIGGRRRPLAGVVTMDQLMADCGTDAVAVGDEVVLIGRQGDEEIGAGEWADRLGTISYEIVCGLTSRLPRRLVG
jgi:alanine racemase